MKKVVLIVIVLFAWCQALTPPAFAGDAPFFKGDVQQAPGPRGLPPEVKNVGIDQKLGDQVNLSLPVKDENGNATTLGAYFGSHPVILVMSYYECPNLCTMVMNGVLGSIKAVPFTPGKDFDVVSVSINPNETPQLAKKKKDSYMAGFHQTDNANGFHFLTADQATITELTKEVGFRYSYDSEAHQYAHASGIMVLTPQGRLSQYFYGIEYAPKDLKYALQNASGNSIGTLTDQLVLFCYHYDPSTKKWSLATLNLLKLGGVITLLGMGTMFYLLRRKSKLQTQLQIRNA